MKHPRASEDEDALLTGINVTPLVDVCLVLVIIFMVTAPLLTNPAFKIELPKARTQEGEEKDKVVLSLSAEGRYALDEKEFKNLDFMTAVLRAKMDGSDSKLVVIRADENAFNGDMTDLMARAKDAGALSITIATNQKK